MIDYAQPAMSAERAMKDMHWAAIENDLDTAMEHCLTALTETRMTLNALKHMKEQRDALREQAQTIR